MDWLLALLLLFVIVAFAIFIVYHFYKVKQLGDKVQTINNSPKQECPKPPPVDCMLACPYNVVKQECPTCPTAAKCPACPACPTSSAAKCPACPACPSTGANCPPPTIGLTYVTNDKDTREIMAAVQQSIVSLQKAGCSVVREQLYALKNSLVNSLDKISTKITCAQITTAVKQAMEPIKAEAAPIDVTDFTNNVVSLVNLALTKACVNGKIDPKKAQTIINNIFNSVCYA